MADINYDPTDEFDPLAPKKPGVQTPTMTNNITGGGTAIEGRMVNNRREDDPYEQPEPVEVPPPAAAPWAPTPGSTNPYDGTMFDPRLSDPVWANTEEGLAEANRQNDYLQSLQQQQNPPPVAAPQPVAPPRVTGGGGGYQTLLPPAPAAPAAPPPVIPSDGATQDREAQQAKADALYEHLMGKAKQAAAIDPNDPNIRRQADTFSANLTRKGRQYLSEMAERKGPSGNIGAESRMMAEKNAQASASQEGQVYQHELDARRAEIAQALAQSTQFMTAQQQMALQREMDAIDNNMTRYQTDLQESQFSRNLAQSGNIAGAQIGQAGAAQAAREREFAQNLSQRAYEYDTDDEYRRSVYADR